MNELGNPNQMVELGELLARTAGAVMEAQDVLDARAMEQKTIYQKTPTGELALPPLWFTFKNVQIDIEMSATVASVTSTTPNAKSGVQSSAVRLLCRPLTPSSVGLYGYQASSGLRVRVLMGPKGVMPIKTDEEITPEIA